MPSHALYDVLYSFKDIHKVVLEFAEELDEEQLNWRPRGYSTSIGFHLWHLARESDFLKAIILERTPQLNGDFGEAKEIWVEENLARRWGFPTELNATVGTGLSDLVASTLPIPPKDELVDYLKRSYGSLESFVTLLDERYPTFDGLEEEFKRKLQAIRLNLLVFLSHDCRHLGMMECLKGLQTGFGSATEKR
ncbi:MAG: DinB family protein [Chloroflexi bacterium]|nr:DinB family protein [Chloroflexota bacterium]MBI3169503.1 DinB family protein [Chloroflexota bacterium]